MKNGVRFILFFLIGSFFLSFFITPISSKEKKASLQKSRQSTREGQFLPQYVPARDKSLASYQRAFQSTRFLETMCEKLNSFVRIPVDVTVCMSECGMENAFYDPRTKKITLCLELIQGIEARYSKILTGIAVLDASSQTLIFISFHELAHCLIHVLDLPITGREEDAADQLATLFFIKGSSGDKALSGAVFFLNSSMENGPFDQPFWDEHSFNVQRFYDITCLVYGSDPDKFASLVTSNTLPAQRARRCPVQFQQIEKSWDKLLAPHLK